MSHDEMEIYDPGADLPELRTSLVHGPRLDQVVGVLGILDNGKPNFDNLMTEMRAVLADAFQVDDVVYRTKPSQSTPAPPEWLDELAGQCGLVLTGSGD